ncbi:MAG: anthranilate phosphoribosyltransferase, partial [Verrucomicrobia bacterium]|nr:anthranilate phosphoribosyltransferase [Verrucomicrobiota bacterium]
MQNVLDALTPRLLATTEATILTPAEIDAVVDALASGDVPDASKAEFLRALSQRGETPGEIAEFCRALLHRAVDPEIDPARLSGPLLDVCGTGGDRVNTFNVSTTTSFILAAGGVALAKHGGRALSSRSGGIDVIQALGVRVVGVSPAEARHCLELHGLCFLWAPDYHPAFAAGVAARRQLSREGISTIFNLLGPLLNPVRPARQLLGVYAPPLTEKLSAVFGELGRAHAWAVHGALHDGTGRGMDEMSILGDTLVGRWENGVASRLHVHPRDAGLSLAGSLDELRGGDAQENAQILYGILAGEIGGGRRDLVLLNAAAGFVVAGLARDLAAGAELARAQIENGR